MASFLTTIQKLKAILDTVSSSILPIKHEYQETQPSQFPTANIIFVRGRETMVDTVTNQVYEDFIIRVIFPTEERQAATEKWLTLLDTLANEFSKDDHQTLTGSAIHFMVLEYGQSISRDYVQPVIVFDILVQARSLRRINA